MSIETEINMEYLLPSLRFHLGDTNSDSYRYLDSWLRRALVNSVISLQSWWNSRYLIDDNYDVYRNTLIQFEYQEPPIIQQKDERPIILMAGIIVKEGSLESSAWGVASWRDAEISYSNIAGGTLRDKSLQRDWDELTDILKPPQKKLARSKKGSLPGYLNNDYDRPKGSL